VTAWRIGLKVLWGQRGAHAGSVAALAVGLAVALGGLGRVAWELGFDRWVPAHERIARVEATVFVPGREPVRSARAPGVAFPFLRETVPGLESAARAIPRQVVAKAGAVRLLLPTLVVDREFLRVFELPGQRAAADPLAAPDAVVLTRAAAARLFLGAPALGGTLQMKLGEREATMRVAAVLDDLPAQSQLAFDALVPMRDEIFAAERWALEDWHANSAFTWIRTATVQEPAALDQALQAALPAHQPHAGADASSDDGRLVLHARPLADVHLRSPGNGDMKPPGDRRQVVLLAALSVAALLMAALNHANLATALAFRRGREMALRRIFGATPAGLAAQAVLESLVLSLVAALLACALVGAAWPVIAALAGSRIPLDGARAAQLGLLALALAMALGLVAGIVPAWRFARAEARGSLFAEARGHDGAGPLRELLCFLQFALAAGFVVSTTLVLQQAARLSRMDLGYEPEGLVNLNVPDPGHPRPLPDGLMDRLRQVPGVAGAARTLVVPGAGFAWTVGGRRSGDGGATGAKASLEIAFVDDAYFRVVGVPTLAGRVFDPARGADDITGVEPPALAARGANVVIDEPALRALGFATAAQAVGRTLRLEHWSDDVELRATIVGVVGGHLLRPSVAEPRPARVYVHDLGWANNAVVRTTAPVGDALRRAWEETMPEDPYRADDAAALFAGVFDEYRALGRIHALAAAGAAVIALLGLHGTAAALLRQRRREIALRAVLGAPPARLSWLVGARLLLTVLAGVLVGVPIASAAMATWLAGFADPVPAFGLAPLLAATACIAAAAVVAGLQVLSVLRVAPGVALREA